jgi:hypothetical protein
MSPTHQAKRLLDQPRTCLRVTIHSSHRKQIYAGVEVSEIEGVEIIDIAPDIGIKNEINSAHYNLIIYQCGLNFISCFQRI